MIKKDIQLANLQRRMKGDASLPLAGSANLVFGEGNEDSKIMFIGEAPGSFEDKLMRPFVGRAGKLLDTLLSEMKLPRESIYITNIVKRRPPENRDPLPEEIARYKPYLEKQIQIIKPQVIVTLGRFSMNYFLPHAKMSQDHGKMFLMKETCIYPLYHPAAALRSTTIRDTLRKDFRKLPKIILKAQS